MIESLKSFFVEGGASFLAVMLISMIPICEARIAIPFGMSAEIWGTKALSPFMSFVAAFIGSSLISFFIILLLSPIFSKLKKTKHFKSFITKLENKFKKQSVDMQNPQNKRQSIFDIWFAVMLFVAIPAPMTGIWTGSAIASFTKLNLLQSFSAIVVGNFFACLLIYFVCTIFKDSIMFLLIASAIMIVIGVIVYLLSKNKKINEDINQAV